MSTPAARRPAEIPTEDTIATEARLIRHQYAMDVLRYPEAHELEHELPLEQREALLAAVVWPSNAFLEWSVARACAKLKGLLGG